VRVAPWSSQARRLGHRGLEISLGSWLTYSGGWSASRTEAWHRRPRGRINFFDTANIYGVGAAETVWGEILKNFRREEVVLATKLFWPMDETAAASRERRSTSSSTPGLERLQTDYATSTSVTAPTPTRRSRRRWRG
jgi:aryl-alcohol dehydrogenase-like predicted oxidoreductase